MLAHIYLINTTAGRGKSFELKLMQYYQTATFQVTFDNLLAIF